jgi:two-component system NtrC family sensor kinase
MSAAGSVVGKDRGFAGIPGMDPNSVSHHVLIADDSRPSREELCATLAEIRTLKVSQVENGAEAISFVEKTRPDLVLCDQTMPVLDGLQALKLLRRRWSPMELPILMLTGSQSVNDKVAAFRFGANDYVTKPAHRQELLARVQAQLALKTAMQQNLAARDRLLQASKLQTVGRLAAGLAHEINTPAQYTSDNLHFLKRAVLSLQTILSPLGEWAAGEGPLGEELVRQLREAWRRQRLDFIIQQAPDAVAQSLHGIERIAALVSELQAFTGGESGEERVRGNVNDAIQSAVGVSRGVWQKAARVELELGADLPLVSCHMPELNQVFLHLVYNAVEAFRGDFGKPPRGGCIQIRSWAAASGVEILVADDGPGIDASIQNQIFDPFFTTKAVGNGTGQGLAIGYDVLVNRHAGRLSYEASPLGGAAFRVWLPAVSTA